MIGAIQVHLIKKLSSTSRHSYGSFSFIGKGGRVMWSIGYFQTVTKIIRVASIKVLTRLSNQTLYMIFNALVTHKCTSLAILF